jgi:hypothetical protein
MIIKITIEKLTIEYIDQKPEPVLKKQPPARNGKVVPEPKVAPQANKVAPKVNNVAPIANKLTQKVKKSATDAKRKRTIEEDRQIKSIQNKKWRLKKEKKLTP